MAPATPPYSFLVPYSTTRCTGAIRSTELSTCLLYTSYDADYLGFSGTETLLGGTTALDTRRVTVRCTVAAREGSLKLVLERGTEKEVLLDGMGSCEKELTLESGSNYLCAVGEDFTGTLDLDVANAPAQRENTAPKGPPARP